MRLSASWNRPYLLGPPFLSEGVQCPYFLGNKENADAAAAEEGDNDEDYCRGLVKALLEAKVVAAAWLLSGVAGDPARRGDTVRFSGLLHNWVPHVLLGVWGTGVVPRWQRKERAEVVETQGPSAPRRNSYVPRETV